MSTTIVNDDLEAIYSRRFSGKESYRQQVWRVLFSELFLPLVPSSGEVLDLGAGYGEFINQVQGPLCYAMDLNSNAGRFLRSDVKWLQQDCSDPWPLQDGSLDLVFTSNFFEHLPDKRKLLKTLREAYRCLKPGGRLVAMGPNIKYLGGAYWDFWDHHVPLTDNSLAEGLGTIGFRMERVVPRILPYTMSDGRRYPLFALRMYLRLPPMWRLFGRQFLVISVK